MVVFGIVLTTLTAIATSLLATAAVVRAFRAVMKQTHLAIREGRAAWGEVASLFSHVRRTYIQKRRTDFAVSNNAQSAMSYPMCGSSTTFIVWIPCALAPINCRFATVAA